MDWYHDGQSWVYADTPPPAKESGSEPGSDTEVPKEPEVCRGGHS